MPGAAPGAHTLHGSQGSSHGTPHSGSTVAGGASNAPRRNQSQRQPTLPARIIVTADRINSFRIIHISCESRSIRSVVCYPRNSTSRFAMCKRNMRIFSEIPQLPFFTKTPNYGLHFTVEALCRGDVAIGQAPGLTSATFGSTEKPFRGQSAHFGVTIPKIEGASGMLLGLSRGFRQRYRNHMTPTTAWHVEGRSTPGNPGQLAGVILAGLAAVVVWGTGTSWARDDGRCPAGPIWTINTRWARCCCENCSDLDEVEVRYRDPGGQWTDAAWSQLTEACRSEEPICWFIHGNRTSHEKAVDEGIELGRLLWGRPGAAGLRLVIWSWPSDRAAMRHVSDGRIKAARCELESRLLAACLRRVDPQSPTCFVGYSFGARIVCDGLHRLVSSGWSEGRNAGSPQARNLRAVLVAAAMDCDWLLPGGRASSAFDPLEAALVTRNCNDPVLRWYSLMYGLRGPIALGRIGIPQPAAPGVAARSQTLDVSCSVGREHGWSEYLQSAALVEQLTRYALFAPVSGQGAKAAISTERPARVGESPVQ